MVDQPSVDFVIITYNQEDYIEEAVRSVADQDYKNLKVYVADDCSKDLTTGIVERLAKEYPGRVIPVIASENQGLTKNTNAGLLAGSGELFAWMGGDDVLLPGKIRKQVNWFLESENRVLCGHKIHLCDEKTNIIGEYSKKLKSGKGIKEWLRYGPLFGAVSVMIRRSVMPKYGFDERLPLSSDWKFYVDCLKNGGEFGFVPEYLGLYRKHDLNITNNTAITRKDSINTLKYLREELGEEHKDDLNKGEAFIVEYGYGVDLMKLGRNKEALRQFLISMKHWPTNFKVYYRVFQSLFKVILG